MIKLCTIDHVHETNTLPNICANRPQGSAWRNTWNRPLFFIFSPDSPTEMTHAWILEQNSSKHGLWGKEVPFGVTHDGRQHFGVQIPQKPSKMAFYTHVRATINGFETNDAIKDLTSLGSPSPASRHWWGSVYYLQHLQNYCGRGFSNIYNTAIVSADTIFGTKISFCKIYTVFVGNLFYRLSHKKTPYAVRWKASKTSKTLICKRQTLVEPFDFAQT